MKLFIHNTFADFLPAHLNVNFEPETFSYFPSRPFMTSLIRLNIGVMSAYLGSETSKYFFPDMRLTVGAYLLDIDAPRN